MSLFLIVLCNQFHSNYTSKDFPLTSIHSIKHSMVRSDFEIPQSFIVGNSKQRINFNSVTNVTFWEPGNGFDIFKQPSKNSPYHLWFRRCSNENLLKVVKRAEDVAIKLQKLVYFCENFGKWVHSMQPMQFQSLQRYGILTPQKMLGNKGNHNF